MSTLDARRAWIKAAEAMGHALKLDEDGRVDSSVLDTGYCNGPGCVTCGESWCWHCITPDEIEACDGGAAKAVIDARRLVRDAAPEMLEALHWAITAVDRLVEVTPSGLLKTGIRAKADEIRALINRVSATPSDTHEVG